MSKSINCVTIVGRLTADAQTLQIPNGNDSMLKMSIACSRMKKDEVDYFNITYFGSSAVSLSQYLKKGTMIGIVGYLRQDRWKDNQGATKTSVGIIAQEIQLLGGGRQQQTQQPQQQQYTEYPDVWGSSQQAWENNPIPQDDIPF